MKKTIIVDMPYYTYLTELTGAATVLRNIISGFEEKQEVILRCWSRDASEITSLEELPQLVVQNIHAKKYSIKQLIRKCFEIGARYHGGLAVQLLKLTLFSSAKKVLGRYSPKTRPNVLLFHDIFIAYQFALQYPDIWNKTPSAVVLHCNGDPTKMLFDAYPILGRSKSGVKFLDEVLGKIFAGVTKIILLGENSREIFCHKYPEYAHKTCSIANGISDISFQGLSVSESTTKLKLLTVGSIGFRKGHDNLVKAINLLAPEIRGKFELHIVGDGSIKGQLEQFCKDNKLDNIIFHGAKKDVLPYLRESDGFILASRDEGLPMAIIEAMRAGLPIIATDVGDCAELVCSTNGWLVSPTIDGVCEGINLWIDDMMKINHCSGSQITKGEYSRELFERKYTLSIMCDKYASLLCNIAD
ncbi:hypothetical protein A4G18_07955 [Pasteurellaceae bacterium Pebbles2]|nr:hypothetical protein [Pasteurellaceae bacterium Pebbles2]